MNATALIGYTGFVGGNLCSQATFDALFNSRNIDQMRGAHFDCIYCAGVNAVKWLANKEPEKDFEGIKRLLNVLETVTVNKAVLFSTVDVFAKPEGVDEESAPQNNYTLHAYGCHRLVVEEFFRSHFNSLIIRLPGLFGNGLKKNIVFDFLHNNNLDQINSHSVFQFYSLDNIYADTTRCLNAGLDLVHFATAPVDVATVAREAFAMDFFQGDAGSAARYDLRTKHAHLWGHEGPYINTPEQSLLDIKSFVARERKHHG